MANKKEEEKNFTWYMKNTKGSHSKFYNISVEKSVTGGWDVISHWGRIGNTGRRRKVSSHNSFTFAKKAAEKLRLEKDGRGYENNTDTQSIIKDIGAKNIVEAAKKRSLNRFIDLLE